MRKISRPTKFLIVLILIFIAVSSYILTVGMNFVADLCAEEIRADITDIINISNLVLQDMDIFYDDYFTLTLNNEGKVELISANTGLINQVNMIIQTEIQNRLNELRGKQLSVTIGSFFGSAVLAQYGTKVTIDANVVANCYTKLISEFIPLGINNTLHRLQINCYVSVKMLIPSKSRVEELYNEILMAESVISGEVPSTYLGENTPTDYLDLLPD
ncbi:MAG: hypothetical protein J5781_01260 [Clostridia bacterium]|nr:hypothetical protein [Clostridia bacterium]